MNEEITITITTAEYKALIKAEIRLSLVTRLVEEERYSCVQKEDLCRILGISIEEVD